jgi:thiamine biosynthesis protein ThiS
MFVIVNGETHPIPEPQTLTALLISLAPQAPFAVAHNEEVVPRADYEACRISPGDAATTVP